ncbi:MAG: sigma-70 family RNA polymerase sigma factor, partial [Chloroflexales bacterium]|nr:sigma-70 family RNA polymerase sigma factor [Chloroflexales bacterium]
MERARGGDASAFGELYARYRDAIYRYVAFRVSDTRDAEDLTGHVFLRAWEALPSYEPRGYRFTSWLYRIAHNLVADHHRGHGAVVVAPLEAGADVPEAQQPTTLERVIAAEEAATLTRAVAKLPAEQRQVVLLRFVHGLSHIDIAQRLAKSQGASRVILHRALATLNQMLRSSLVAVLAVLMLLGGVVYAARTARPGEPLYVVRSSVEMVRQALPAPQPAPPTATLTPTSSPTPTVSPQQSPVTSPAAQIVAPLPPTHTPSATPAASLRAPAPTLTPVPISPSATARVELPSVTPAASAPVEPPSATPSATPAP